MVQPNRVLDPLIIVAQIVRESLSLCRKNSFIGHPDEAPLIISTKVDHGIELGHKLCI